MWLDNASEVDILFYEPYANVIADISKNPNYKPLTIGVFGVWGAGKSTLLKLIEQKIDEDSEGKGKTLCININAWTFEGYEDAKIALMEALLREIKEHKDIPSRVKNGVSKLLKKLDFFKLATKAVSVGAPMIASVATGNPIPLLLSVSGKAEDVGNGIKSVADAMQSIRDYYGRVDVMMNLIDTHFHLDYYKNYPEIAKNITEQRQYTICVTNSPGVFMSCKKIISETRYLKFAIGFHPRESSLCASDIRDFTRLIRLTNYVGEIGLDYSSKSYMNKQQQLRFFSQVVDICSSENKLMTIHIRKAEEDAITILERYKPNKVIIHWYTGNRANMKKLVDLGCYFSINTNMVNSRASEKYHLLPRERLLIESDGPYTKVNNRKYSPLLLKDAYEVIAKFYDNPDLIRDVYENFKRILSV